MSDYSRWQDEFQPEAGQTEVRVVRADLSALPELLHFVVEQGQRTDLLADDCARLAIVVEELFINSVTHGYGQRGESPVIAERLDEKPCDAEVRLALGGGGNGIITVDYQDRGTPFNPLIDGPEIPGSDELASGYLKDRVGGVGLWLLRNFARSPRYDREGSINRLRFELGIEPEKRP